MRIALVGNLGHIGQVFDALKGRADAEIVTVTGGFLPGDADWLAERSRGIGHSPRICPGLSVALEAGKPDVVCIDGPFADHAHMAILALRHGAHVFLEKPAVFDDASLAALRLAVAQSGRRLMTMMTMRTDPPFRAAVSLARSGAIGRVRLVNAQKSYKLGSRPEFYRHRETFGGLIPWIGVHAVDLVRAVTRQRFESVAAWQGRDPNFGHGDLETSAVCQFLLADGALASASVDYLRPDSLPGHGDDRLRVVGERGIVEARGDRCELNGVAQVLPPSEILFAHFLDSVAARCAPVIDHEDVFSVAAASLAAQRAADTGRIVQIGGVAP